MSGGATPKATIVIPAYNGEAYIADAVRSALAQSFASTEVVIVDDGSTDRTRDVVGPLVDGEKLRYHYQRNSGHGAARNTGAELARGSFVCFLDQDDLLEADAVAMRIALFNRYPDLGFVFSDFRIGTQAAAGSALALHESTLRRYRSLDRLPAHCVDVAEADHRIFNRGVARELLLDCFAWIGTVMIPASVLKTMGPFPIDLRYSPDHDLLVRIADRYRTGFVEGSTAVYRQHDTNMSRYEVPLYDEAIRIRSRYLDQWDLDAAYARRLRRGIAEYHFRKGRLLIGTPEHRQGRYEFRRAVELDPTWARAQLYRVLGELPQSLVAGLRRARRRIGRA